MGRSQESFSKREKEKKRQKRKEDKQKKKEERKANSDGGGLDNMIAYVDEYGNITDTPPPEKDPKKAIKAEDIEVSIPKRGNEEIDPVHKGVLQNFNTDKGFGFATSHNDGESYFVHISDMEDGISEGNKVQFELEKGDRGMKAVKMKKA